MTNDRDRDMVLDIDLQQHINPPECTYREAEEVYEETAQGTILNLNIRGLRANLDGLKELLDSFENSSYIKIIALSELFNSCSDQKNNYLDSHTLISACRVINCDRGGVGFMVSNDLQFSKLKIQNEFIEGLFESITIKIPAMKSIMTCVYRPNGHDNSNTGLFIENLENHMKQVQDTDRFRDLTHYYMGDFNIDMNKPNERYTRKYLNTMITNLYIPCISVDTRVCNQSSTLIDQIWTNNPSIIDKAYVIENVYIADHLVNGVTLLDRTKQPHKIIYTRKFTDENMAEFTERIKNQNWAHVRETANCNMKWERLTEAIKSILDDTCPLKRIKIQSSSKPNKLPYMTEALKSSQNTMGKLGTCAKRDPLGIKAGNTENNWKIFTEYRKTYSKLRRCAKRTYFQEKFGQIKHNAKQTWALINQLIKNKFNDTNINEIFYEDEKITNPKDISSAFNRFYSRVGNMQAASIPPTETDPMAFLRGLPPESIFFHPCTKDELMKTTKILAKKRSKGPDSIPCFILLNNVEHMSEIMLHCINFTLTTGIFPSCLKEALVIPIYKKKDRLDTTNYRPVSLLNALSKVLEKILYFRIYSFMSKRMCLTQFGFRPSMTTQDLMIYTVESICRLLNKEGFALPLFFDLGKAFDTLNHEVLLRKLEHYGIRGLPLELLRSYLTGRKQKVAVGGEESEYLPIDIGVPQGSVLGPLLFIIYVNDIINASPKDKIGLYADDTTCITGAKSEKECVSLAKAALEKLGNWFAANGLSLSPTKCKYALMNDALTTSSTKVTLSIYGKKLTEVRKNTESTNSPLVGYLFTENLNPKEHIESTISKIRSGIYALKINKSMPIEVKKSIYFATVHSHITYAGIIVGCAARKQLKELEKLQSIAIRVMAGAKYNENVDHILKKHKILKVPDLLGLQAAGYGWKYFNKSLPTAIDNFMETEAPDYINSKGIGSNSNVLSSSPP